MQEIILEHTILYNTNTIIKYNTIIIIFFSAWLANETANYAT